MSTWTPDITKASVEIKHQAVMENYPVKGTPGIAILGKTVLHGTFQDQHTPSIEWVVFRIDGVTINDLLWFRDGWTFKVLDESSSD